LHLAPIIIGISLLQGPISENEGSSREGSSGELTEAADELLEWLTLGAELGTIKKWRKGGGDVAAASHTAMITSSFWPPSLLASSLLLSSSP